MQRWNGRAITRTQLESIRGALHRAEADNENCNLAELEEALYIIGRYASAALKDVRQAQKGKNKIKSARVWAGGDVDG